MKRAHPNLSTLEGTFNFKTYGSRCRFERSSADTGYPKTHRYATEATEWAALFRLPPSLLAALLPSSLDRVPSAPRVPRRTLILRNDIIGERRAPSSRFAGGVPPEASPVNTKWNMCQLLCRP